MLLVQFQEKIVIPFFNENILTVHAVGEFQERQYLVTELVDGGTLGDWVKKEKRTWRHIVELLIGVADGLAAAHAAWTSG